MGRAGKKAKARTNTRALIDAERPARGGMRVGGTAGPWINRLIGMPPSEGCGNLGADTSCRTGRVMRGRVMTGRVAVAPAPGTRVRGSAHVDRPGRFIHARFPGADMRSAISVIARRVQACPNQLSRQALGQVARTCRATATRSNQGRSGGLGELLHRDGDAGGDRRKGLFGELEGGIGQLAGLGHRLLQRGAGKR
jgi:hypothetical protein